jgi:hypothetical protein
VAALGSSGDPPAPIWVHDERIKAAVVAFFRKQLDGR